MKIGVCYVPRTPAAVSRAAQVAEAGGIELFGVADSPFIYAEAYQALQWAFEATTTLRVGTMMTNPVTRHWSVVAAAHRGLNADDTGRSFLGIAAGDSAVHTAGLRPASPDQLADYVSRFRDHAPRTTSVMVAAGGPKSVGRASRYADHLLLGQGASREATAHLLAHSPREESPEPWMFLMLNLARSSSQVPEARDEIVGPILGMSRNAFSAGLTGKAFPESLQADLREVMGRYDFLSHARSGDSPNARLLAAFPRLRDYLVHRFGLVGEPGHVVERLHEIQETVGVSNFVLSVISLESEQLLERACRDVVAHLV